VVIKISTDITQHGAIQRFQDLRATLTRLTKDESDISPAILLWRVPEKR
jgi:hypothetical protein